MTTVPRLFRVTVAVADLEAATDLYRDLLGIDGHRHPGSRHCQDGTLYT